MSTSARVSAARLSDRLRSEHDSLADFVKRTAKEIVAEVNPEPAPERTVVAAVSTLLRTPDLRQAALGQPSTSMPTPTPTTQEVRPAPPTAPLATVIEPKTSE